MNESIEEIINTLQGIVSVKQTPYMSKEKYYSIREDIGILDNISKFINYIMDITEIYPNLKSMTLEDARMYLIDRHSDMSLKIEKELNVK